MTESQEYDDLGNISIKRDGNLQETYYEYDEYGRLATVTNAKGETTSYTYDTNGNMLTQKDVKGNIITFRYNAANKLIQKTDHGGITGENKYDPKKTESYTYYADGSLETSTDRNGNTTTYVYDCHGRLISKTSGDQTIQYTYDGNGNQLTITVNGKDTTTRTYDELGRVLTKDVPNIGKTQYIYDVITKVPNGFTAEISIDPAGNKTSKVYDRAGRLKAVKDGDILSESPETVYEYYDNGARKSVTYPGGITEEYTYFANGLLETLVNKRADGTLIDSYKYTYDNAGNQLTKQEYINGVNKGITTYTYDALNRLETITEPSGRFTKYTYDAAGNRETELIALGSDIQESTYTYNEQNRLNRVTVKKNGVLAEIYDYTYDNNGNQLTVTRTEYINGIAQTPEVLMTNEYDRFNQLVKTVAGDTTIINSYNGEGLREAKAVNGIMTRYLYEYDKVILETDASGKNVTARNIYGTNLLARMVENEVYYYLYNGHADVTGLVNAATGTVDATYYYDAFGNILESTGNVNNNITYAGYQYDEETGLYYLNARMYDPRIARFLQEDTYRGDPNDPLSLNLYTYCVNNPLIYYDPTGHFNIFSGEDWKNVGKSIVKQGKGIIDNTVQGATIIFDSEKRKEAFELIDKYGTESEKILSRVYAGVGVAATATALTATAVYAAPAVAAAATSVATTVSAAATSVSTWATTTGATVATTVATKVMPIINSAAMNTDKIITKADVGINAVNAGISIYNRDYNQALTDLIGTLEAFYTERYVSLNSIGNKRNIPVIAGVGTEDDINGFGDVKIPTLPKNKTQKDYLSAIQSDNNGNGSTFRPASNVSDTGDDNRNKTVGFGERLNTPSYKKVEIDMEEVISGHTANGSRAKQSQIKDLFPDDMSEAAIEKEIRLAYKNGKQVGSPQNDGQTTRIKLQGTGERSVLEMWYNVDNKVIETAYPISGKKVKIGK